MSAHATARRTLCPGGGLIHSQYTTFHSQYTTFHSSTSKSKSGHLMGPVGHESAPFTLALVVLFTVLTDVSTLHMP